MKKPTESVRPDLRRNPVHWLAFGFGSGLSPVAPGTFGTLAAIPLYLLLSNASLWLYLSVTLVMFVVGVYLCGKTSGDLGVEDHPGIVWDEIVGYLVTMIAAPAGIIWVATGFVLFRFFDILKPWPIGYVDSNVKGGTGIMIDDVLAGVYGLIVIQLLIVVVG
ncbi:MAG TPA: phosphatidylglycerophosphatase A [Gammaproteobacteria bacterium]|nr:phosphatidylglycerophosphatase A [Gammaproteobacteria bacterium]